MKMTMTISKAHLKSLIDEVEVLCVLRDIETAVDGLAPDHPLYNKFMVGRDQLMGAAERLNKKNSCWPVQLNDM